MNKTVTNPLGLALFAGVGLAAYRFGGCFKEAATKRKVKSFPTPSVSGRLSSFQSA